jgi:hypothetical protein
MACCEALAGWISVEYCVTFPAMAWPTSRTERRDFLLANRAVALQGVRQGSKVRTSLLSEAFALSSSRKLLANATTNELVLEYLTTSEIVG